MVTEIELAWLAGMWDADGSISLFKAQGPKICPCINVTNSNEEIIAEVLRLLDLLGTSFHVQVKQDKKHHKPTSVIQTRNMSYIEIVLESILPYLVGKKSRAQIVLRHVKKRMKVREGKKGRGPTYDDEDWNNVDQMRELNRRGIPNPQRLNS